MRSIYALCLVLFALYGASRLLITSRQTMRGVGEVSTRAIFATGGTVAR